ncbi:hypothetical protein BWI93_03135 [Siphonobacter sp. BAB-5385]|uniref:hypothetical protein n=1 Tax=Siphonobacter sp. BAB-5385 TaxID=1864822 RepID=UPI000B9E53F5|nr:hypothetical protein [Siphonobacter sp. BAB-5385]OZI09590.1 hypothetical protein BWI93_03135 [Siphonobacter sp. BAB-5385]
MADKKYFAIEQTNGTPTSVQEISADKYQQAVKGETPGKQIKIKLFASDATNLKAQVGNVEEGAKLNWSIYEGDAYVANPKFIEGDRENLEVKNTFVEIDLNPFKSKLRNGVSYRLYLALPGVQGLEAFIDFAYEAGELSKKIEIHNAEMDGYSVLAGLSNYGSAERFNWSVSRGDAYKGGEFIHGWNDGRLKVDAEGDIEVSLYDKREVLKDGETLRLYVNDYANPKETENFADFIYKAPIVEEPDETGEHSQPGKPNGPNKPVEPQPETQEGEIRAIKYDPSKGLEQIPVYRLADGAINILQSDVPFPVQAEFARKGMITHMHLNLDAVYGGPYNDKWNPKGLKYEQMGELMKAYNIPKHIGAYRMMYQNALDDIWPRKPRLANGEEDPNPFPNSQHELNERVAGYLMGIMQAVGWGDRPAILDLDFESGDFFTWGGVQAIAQAVKYSRKKFPNQRFLVYAGAHSNNAVEGGGSPNRPELHVGPGPRFEAFRGAGVDITQGTVPYFRTPRQEWDNPPHYESVIGSGKPYASEKEYGLKSIIKTIGAKLDWTDGFLRTLPAGYKPSVFEWYMPVYEGGDNGEERRYYDNGEVWTSWNWLQVGEWIQESFPVWAGVTGTYRFGGGAHLWTDGRPWLPSNYALELGKVRLYSYNEFLNNPATQYNIQLEFSLDGGKTWVKDTPRTGTNPDAHLEPRGFIRAAYLKGKLWVVATAGQPFHNAGKPQQVLIRYNGKTFNRTLEPLTVHSFTVEI